MKILITSLGSGVAFSIIKCLRESKEYVEVYGIDTNENNTNICFADYFYKSPRINDSNYLSFLKYIIKKEHINVLWPINTNELSLISGQKELLERELDIKIIINFEDVINISNHKGNLYDYLLKYIPEIIPKYKSINNYEKLIEAIYELGYPKNKICIKKCIGSGSRGLKILDSNINVGESILNSQGNTIISNIEEVKLLKNIAKRDFPEMLVSEYLPYEEYDVDIISFNGQNVCCIPRLNVSMFNGTSVITKSIRNDELIRLSKKIIQVLKLNYINSITFKYGYDNKPYLVEINPRVPATITATKNCGVNYPKILLDFINGKNIKDYKVDYGITTVRYWDEYHYK